MRNNRIRVYGAGATKHRSIIKEAGQFALECLKVDDLEPCINVTLIDTVMADSICEFWGDCNYADGSADRPFQIRLTTARDDFDEVLETLFHELVHVRQFLDGDLVYASDQLSWGDWYAIWRTKAGNLKVFDRETVEAAQASGDLKRIKSLPFEREAIIVAASLIQAFKGTKEVK